MKRIPPSQIRTQPINISDAEMRMLLRFSFSQLCGAYPAGLFAWLESKFPKIHEELTGALPQGINCAWRAGVRKDFAGAIQKFLDCASAAIAVHELRGRR